MPSPVRFAEIRRYLESHGWTLERISGSHHVFTKPGRRTFPIPVHGGKVKYGYLKEAKEKCEKASD
ncbi:MAG: type II toxin-antitoxin system HicA family toxin [Tepidisphaerales bacterium]